SPRPAPAVEKFGGTEDSRGCPAGKKLTHEANPDHRRQCAAGADNHRHHPGDVDAGDLYQRMVSQAVSKPVTARSGPLVPSPTYSWERVRVRVILFFAAAARRSKSPSPRPSPTSTWERGKRAGKPGAGAPV